MNSKQQTKPPAPDGNRRTHDGVRLVRYLAQCGVASRRSAGDLVRDGLVEVNGEVTTNMALAVRPSDKVRVRGREVSAHSRPIVVMLNKPAGLVCSCSDPHNPDTVLDVLPPGQRERLKPVGRLDKETTGLLLLTDDGDLAYRLTHPSYGVEKTYRVTIEGRLSASTLQRLRDGLELEDGPTAPAKVTLTRYMPKTRLSTVEMVLHEGRNRQVRRMFEAVGHRVQKLKRVRYGPLTLDDLKCGTTRPLRHSEVQALRKLVKL